MVEETKEIVVGGDKFLRSKKLGGGSFGEIYLGTNMQTHELVAIKIVCQIHANRFKIAIGRSKEMQASTVSIRVQDYAYLERK